MKYDSNYNPNLLFQLSRSENRDLLPPNVKFEGVDIWNCYEVSWLNLKGKPEVGVLEIYIPASSPNIVESKSLKLYLNSFNNEKYSTEKEVLDIMKRDLEKIVGTEITLILKELDYFSNEPISKPEGICIDNIDIECVTDGVLSELLKTDSEEEVEETLHSNLLKSNCLITHQPDWASVTISYKGPKIDHGSLLRYIVSFRNHDEFHEHCVERMYADLLQKCKCSELTVYARYTRRGGIDINPVRSSAKIDISKNTNQRLARQ